MMFEINNIPSLITMVTLILLNIFCVESQRKKQPGIIYILIWTPMFHEPFAYWKHKRKSFIAMNCEFQNCYISEDKNMFEDITEFDAVLLNTIDITGVMELPRTRADNQVYVYVSTESAANYPQTAELFNYYFNYTWTYKLNSDITYPYLIVRSKLRRKVVGPGKRVHWLNTTKMRPTEESVKSRLQNKSIAGAWFVTNCLVDSRLNYAHSLNDELRKYNLSIDIYGGCGNKACPREQIDTCFGLIESDYYFYLSFENSFSEDYVTEKLLTALDHYAVPIVIGGADYSRFMPDGIYLNAQNYKPVELAKLMSEIINDKEKYYDFFKWHRYYSYHAAHESSETDPLCAFCAFLNDRSKMSQRRAITNFVKWWNEDRHPRNDTENYVIVYGETDPNIRSFVSYRDPKQQTYNSNSPTVLNQVGSLMSDLINYYFE